jgi:phosphatidylglycerophosphate synthase
VLTSEIVGAVVRAEQVEHPSRRLETSLRFMSSANPARCCACAVLVEPAAETADARAFGLSARERLERTFASLGLRTLAPEAARDLGGERAVALCGDHFYDERLIVALAESPDDLLLVVEEPDGGQMAVGLVGRSSTVERYLSQLGSRPGAGEGAEDPGVRWVTPTDLVPAYDAKLRKNAPPFVLPVDAERALEAEARIFDASYKGATDFVTKWLWPLPAKIVTRWCARRGVSPNWVTMWSYVLAVVTLVAFAGGAFAPGLVTAWLMTFLDTVDGKLARVTLTSTKLGDRLDHGLDLIHPPLWWAAWGAGLAGPAEVFGAYWPWVTAVFVGYIVGRLLEGLFILAFDQEMFTWRPFDFAFRLVIARRNPNLVLLTGSVLVGRPDVGFKAIVIWTLVCIGVQCVRIGQAGLRQLQGETIRPFAEELDAGE